MQDGQNLFFPDEAFAGKHWRVPETLGVLDSMGLIRPAIVVGIYPRDRMTEYTWPGYEEYGRFVATELVPWVDEGYRTLRAPTGRAIMGSSLGGVVSFHIAWSFPELFGMVGCMSSAFGFRDDLVARVANGSRRPLRIYLDSGWPSDNYEATRGLHATLIQCGYRDGRELAYVAFPDGMHDESSWARRAHIPFQFFFRSR
jgi:enterochelin esterase-like enzyme